MTSLGSLCGFGSSTSETKGGDILSLRSNGDGVCAGIPKTTFKLFYSVRFTYHTGSPVVDLEIFKRLTESPSFLFRERSGPPFKHP